MPEIIKPSLERIQQIKILKEVGTIEAKKIALKEKLILACYQAETVDQLASIILTIIEEKF